MDKSHYVAPTIQLPPMEIGVSPKRWAILFLFFWFGLCNQVQYTAFATIVTETKQYFDTSSLGVNILAAMFPLVYAIGVFPGCHLYENLGLRGGMCIGTGFNAVGAGLKFIACFWPHYWMLVVGQFLNAIGQVLFLSLPPLVASTWFPHDERTIATALGTLSGFLGMAVGMFYSPLIVHNRGDKEHFAILMGSQLAVAALVFLGSLVIVDPAPPMSPSLTANRRTEEIAVWPILKGQLKNRNMMILCIAFGCINGLYTGLAAVMSQLLGPFGLSESQTGTLAFAGILAGSVSCAIIAPIVDKYRKYKMPIIILYMILLGFGVITTILMKVIKGDLVVGAFVLIIIMEIVVLPVIPLVMELSVELTYPDPESISSSLALVSMCIWSAVGIGIYSVILGNDPGRDESFNAMAFTVAASAISTAALFFVEEKRVRYDTEQSSLTSSPQFIARQSDDKFHSDP
jgi:MFS family permease